MNPLWVLKLGGAAAIVLALYGGYKYIEHGGVVKGRAEIQVKLEKLQAQVDAADIKAKEDVKIHKENFDAVKKDNADRVARINDHYKRLLRTKAGGDSSAVSTSGIDGTGGEQGISGCDIALELACALDANKIDAFQQWVIKNNIPVE